MRVVCVWRRESEYGRALEEWIMEFERRTGREVESLEPDEAEGEQFCRTYDVVEYPTIMVLSNGGEVLANWRGQQLPLFDEVSYWATR